MNSITAEVLNDYSKRFGIYPRFSCEINPKENKDVTDRRMDEALDQISEAEI